MEEGGGVQLRRKEEGGGELSRVRRGFKSRKEGKLSQGRRES